MRLRDKNTGEINNVHLNCGYAENKINARMYNGEDHEKVYEVLEFKSLAELNERFEDAPEEIKPFEEVAKAKYQMGYYADTFTEDNVERGGDEEVDVADIDYYEILPDGTKKTEFTWDEAMEIEKKTNGKWRVPTQAEWFAIASAFGVNEDGEVTGKTLAKNLNLTTDKDGYGNYWSSTPSSYAYARHLRFLGTYVNPQNNSYKPCSFTVRCVSNWKGKKYEGD